MEIDWTAIEQEFILTPVSFKELSIRHGIKEGTMRARAHRFGWVAKRTDLTQRVTAKAAEAIADTRAEDLAKWNEQDIRLAQALRAQIAANLKAAQDAKRRVLPNDLRALASTAETAQKIARLALNATTVNTGVSNPEGGPVAVRQASLLEGVDLDKLSIEELHELESAVAAIERHRANSGIEGEAQPS